MQTVPKTPQEALAILRDPKSEDWERDYAIMMSASLDEALPDIVAIACDSIADEMLQQRAAEVLGGAWRDRGTLMTEDISDFTPTARQEILFHRGEAPPFKAQP